jgi:hypothetical protein
LWGSQSEIVAVVQNENNICSSKVPNPDVKGRGFKILMNEIKNNMSEFDDKNNKITNSNLLTSRLDLSKCRAGIWKSKK